VSATPVDAARFFDFIRGSRLAVVFVSVHPAHTFNEPLSELLTTEHGDISLGTIKLKDVVVSAPVLHFLHDGLRRCGAPLALGVLPGYCLFRRSELLAWQSGFPTLQDVEAIARSAALGALWSSVTHNPSFIAQAAFWGSEHVAARRVAVAFREALSSQQTHYRQTATASAPPPFDELQWAYRVLNVPPAASDHEIHLAWRQRRMEAHPDAVMSDPAEFERRSRLSAEINRARDIIVRHRKNAWDHAAYAKAS
jgi:hypothetical protein